MFSSFTIDIKKIPIYLLIGYIFFAFLINYPSLVIYENIFLLFFIASVFLSIEIKNITISPLILIYGLLSLISTINNLFLYDRYGINKSIITMPLIFLAMVACRSISQAGLFIKLIIINAVPYILLLPIGGHIEWGRYYSYFVSENLQGIVLPFTFSVGLYLAYGRKLFFGAIVCISVPLFFFVVSARRSLLIYFLVSIFIFLVSIFQSNLSKINKILLVITIGIALSFPFSQMIDRQFYRYEDGVIVHLEALISGSASDQSTSERRKFIEVSFESLNEHWLGVGNGNFPHIMKTYAPDFPEAAHPHAGLAEAAVDAGYPGILLYFLLIIYLFRIGFREPIMRLCLVWLLMSSFFDNYLSEKIIWIFLALAESELQKYGKLQPSNAQ